MEGVGEKYTVRRFALCLLAIGLLCANLSLYAQDAISESEATAATTEPTPTVGIVVGDERAAWDGTYRRIRIPILMYHYISRPSDDADDVRRDLSVSPELFRQHMEYLFYQGYQTISLYQADEALRTGAALPPKPVVLTFDDSYADHYTNAFPILRQFNFSGTFFVITGFTDESNPNHLTWEQVAAMANAGMFMESHTKTHPELVERDYDFLVYQVMGSIESLTAYTGRPPRMFAYPVGRYDANTVNVLNTMPIWRAVTTERGAWQTSDNRLLMPRLRVTGEMGVDALASLLNSD